MTDRERSALRQGLTRGRRTFVLGIAVGALHAVAAEADVTDLSLEQLMQVTVVGASKYEQKQSEVAAAVTVITRQEIVAFGWRTIDEALASLPGVYSTYDRQYTYLGTRGLGLPGDYTARILVTIDGNRVNDPTFDTGPSGRQFPLSIDLIERIEFIPGPGGAVYGQNAMFGVINIVTRTGADVNGTEVAASYQEPQALDEFRATWGRQFDNGLNVLVSMDGMNARGQNLFFNYGASGVSGIAAGLDGDYDRQFFGSASRGPWSLELLYANHVKNDPTAVYSSEPLVPGQFQADGYTLGQLRYDDRFAADTLEVSARVFSGQERYTSELFYGTYSSFPAVGDWAGAELRLLYTAFAGHKLMFGAEGQDNIRQDQYILNSANPLSNIYIPGSGYRVGAYAQDEWRLTAQLTSTFGVRADRDNVDGTKLSPRLALIWQASDAGTVKALYGRAFRSPNAYERNYYDNLAEEANPGLHGESMDTIELVGDYRASRELGLRVSVYRWTLNDLITLGTDPLTGLAQYQSGETDHARGVELSADRTWDCGARLRGSVSLQEVTRPGGAPLVNSPKTLGKLEFSTPLPLARLRLALESQYDSARLTLNGTSVGGYPITNVRVNRDGLIKGLDASLGVFNLFDRHYAEPAATTNWQNALEQDGRSVALKLTYAF